MATGQWTLCLYRDYLEPANCVSNVDESIKNAYNVIVFYRCGNQAAIMELDDALKYSL